MAIFQVPVDQKECACMRVLYHTCVEEGVGEDMVSQLDMVIREKLEETGKPLHMGERGPLMLTDFEIRRVCALVKISTHLLVATTSGEKELAAIRAWLIPCIHLAERAESAIKPIWGRYRHYVLSCGQVSVALSTPELGRVFDIVEIMSQYCEPGNRERLERILHSIDPKKSAIQMGNMDFQALKACLSGYLEEIRPVIRALGDIPQKFQDMKADMALIQKFEQGERKGE